MGFFFKKENSGLKQKSIKSESSSAIFLFLTAEDFQRWRVNAKGKGRRKNLTLSIWSSLRCQSQNDSKNYWQVDRSLTFFFFLPSRFSGRSPDLFSSFTFWRSTYISSHTRQFIFWCLICPYSQLICCRCLHTDSLPLFHGKKTDRSKHFRVCFCFFFFFFFACDHRSKRETRRGE